MQIRPFPSSAAPSTEQNPIPPPQPQKSSRTPKKKMYILIGIIAIAAVIIATVLILQIPQGTGQTIQYSISYKVGEKLTYNYSSTTQTELLGTIAETGNLTLRIMSFDGENYTLNETMYTIANGTPSDYSFTAIINKEGELVGTSNIAPQLQEIYSSLPQGLPGIGMFLNRTQIRVGDTYLIPLGSNSSSTSTSGTENITIAKIENTNVPAGTYKTFKIEISTNNFQMSIEGISTSLNLAEEIHMHYNRCIPIDLNMQTTETVFGETITSITSMTLIQDTTP